MSTTSIAFTDLVTRGSRKTHSDKSTFLCYADATLRVSVDGAEVLSMRVRNAQLKVLNGRFRVDFHAEQGKDGQWYPTLFPKSAGSRRALTAAMREAYAALLQEQKVVAAA